MNGIKTLVLQDLPHILPPKALQLHTTSSSRRFWNFFEFSLKEDAACRHPKKCPSSKDIASSSLLPNEFESVSRNRASLSAGSTISSSLNPKIHIYQFDDKSNPVNSSRIPKPLGQADNLVSLLDGNPVPKTMKWKLKGYKTLRHEQSSDFAFVPGGNCYDLDILSRSENNAYSKAKNEGTVNEDTLCLTTKAIENKQNDVKVEKEAMQLESNTSSSSNNQNVSNQPVSKIMQSLLTTVKKEDQFLPIPKSKLSQPSAQYSSHPPKKVSKPLPPGMETNKGEHLMEDARSSDVDKPISPPSPESYQQQASISEKPSITPVEVSESAPSEWSSMEQPKSTKTELSHDKELMENPRLSSEMSENKSKEDNEATFSKPTESTYFAPRPWKYSNLPKSNLTSKFDGEQSYESFLGVPLKSNSMKITNPYENQPVRTSPCAATQARLLQGAKNLELQTRSQNNSQSQQAGSSGLGGSSMTGGSGGGSRKPPTPYPSFSARRSSSNATCLSKKIPRNTSGKSANKNSSSNISTSSATLMPKKCGDRDEKGEGRVICTRPRQNKCGRQRKCGKEKKDKKICKRYCCPRLHESTICDYSKDQCPKTGKRLPAKKPEKTDPTCLDVPKQKKQEQGREICTRPRRRRDCSRERTCDRERPRSRERSRQSCKREQSGSRNRSRSCKRQEQRDCSRNREGQGREICTKPRKRDSCNRRRCNDRSCGRRPAKCSGRRNYTHSAFTGRQKSSQNIKRYSSLPAFAFSLINMKSNNESKQNLFEPAKGRFYGKKPPSCKPPESDNKCKKPASSADVKCKTPPKSENKCKPAKKTERICKPPKKAESTCKTDQRTEDKCQAKKTERICKPPKKAEIKCKTDQRTEDKCQVKTSESICKPTKKTEPKCKTPPKKHDPCKARSKSDDYCAKKREQLCKDRKSAASSSQEESAKDRMEREKKEMEECKKDIKKSKKDKGKKKDEKVMVKGLERVVSPCKQKQTKKCEKDPSKKMSCIGIPLNCLISKTVANAVSMPEHKSFGILPDRNYSVMRSADFNDGNSGKPEFKEEKRFWRLYDDEDYGMEAIPIPLEVDDQDDSFNDTNSSKPSWFLSWFNNNRP